MVAKITIEDFCALRADGKNTAVFIDRFSEKYPDRWCEIDKKYDKPGYTGRNYVGRQLQALVDRGLLWASGAPAPEGWGHPEITVWHINGCNAVEDLDCSESDADVARVMRLTAVYARDVDIRNHVVKRAGGKCEFCGAEGFLKSDGTRYLEAHHIISLANQGGDSLENVIALCANHHREAHFGADRLRLEAVLLEKIARIRGK